MSCCAQHGPKLATASEPSAEASSVRRPASRAAARARVRPSLNAAALQDVSLRAPDRFASARANPSRSIPLARPSRPNRPPAPSTTTPL